MNRSSGHLAPLRSHGDAPVSSDGYGPDVSRLSPGQPRRPNPRVALEALPQGVCLHASAAIFSRTMGETPPRYPIPRRPAGEKPCPTNVVAEEPPATPEQLRSIAHARGRICKLRQCEVCAPLREGRRLKKAQRKAYVQLQLHAKGAACARASCLVAACVESRNSKAANTAAPVVGQADGREEDPGEAFRRQTERHRAGLKALSVRQV